MTPRCARRLLAAALLLGASACSTVAANPDGGGAYSVSGEHFGGLPLPAEGAAYAPGEIAWLAVSVENACASQQYGSLDDELFGAENACATPQYGSAPPPCSRDDELLGAEIACATPQYVSGPPLPSRDDGLLGGP